jgi:uncharacterized membrane protein
MVWTDERVERTMGGLLRAGVILSAAVVLMGAAWYFTAFGNAPVDYRTFRGEPASLREPVGVMRGVLAGDARSLIQLGLMLLIGTPVARVAFAIFAFAAQRDKVYVGIGLTVLAALAYGLKWW